MDYNDKKIIEDFKNRIPENIAQRIEKIIVYGSRARNEEVEFSDLDVAIIVDRKEQVIEEELDEIAYQVMWKYDFQPFISLKIFSKQDFENALKNGFSFYQNVEKEGIVL